MDQPSRRTNPHSTYLIAGIDPGTTIGYALTTLDGKPILVGSRKELSTSDLLNILIDKGHILLVGTDKAKTPDLVATVATQVGARTISPQADLSVLEKKEMTAGHSYANTHEMDALACAIFAHRQIQNLHNRVIYFADTHERTDLIQELMRIVLKKGMSIQGAYDLLTEERTVEDLRKTETQNQPDYPTIIKRLTDKIITLKEETIFLTDKQRSLASQIRTLEHANRKLTAQVQKRATTSPAKQQQKYARQEQLLQKTTSTLKHQERTLSEKSRYLSTLKNTLFSANDRILIQQLPNMARKQPLHSKYLYVESPNEFTESFVDEINKHVTYLFTNHAPSTSLTQALAQRVCVILHAPIKHTPDFGYLTKEEFDSALKEKDSLRRVIDSYKRSRPKP